MKSFVVNEKEASPVAFAIGASLLILSAGTCLVLLAFNLDQKAYVIGSGFSTLLWLIFTIVQGMRPRAMVTEIQVMRRREIYVDERPAAKRAVRAIPDDSRTEFEVELRQTLFYFLRAPRSRSVDLVVNEELAMSAMTIDLTVPIEDIDRTISAKVVSGTRTIITSNLAEPVITGTIIYCRLAARYEREELGKLAPSLFQ